MRCIYIIIIAIWIYLYVRIYVFDQSKSYIKQDFSPAPRFWTRDITRSILIHIFIFLYIVKLLSHPGI